MTKKPLGQRIREIREARGLSQGELADSIGIKQPSLSEIENGRSVPREATLFALAVALQDDFDDPRVLDYLAKRGNSNWEQVLTPALFAVQRNDFLLDILLYRLARISDRFRRMIDDETFTTIKIRAEALIDMLAQQGTVGPLKKPDTMLARNLGKVGEEPAEERKRKVR